MRTLHIKYKQTWPTAWSAELYFGPWKFPNLPLTLVRAEINRTTINLDSPVDEPLADLEAYIDGFFYNMPNNKPDSKRFRNELSSSDMDDTSSSSGISESLTSIKLQLKKLDLLEQLTTDVQELKASVEFNNALIEVRGW